MANNIKGLTVEIGGDTSKLEDALKNVNKATSSLSSELGSINRLLKFDPQNTELLAQKQAVLTNAINETKNKLDILKEAETQVQEQFEKGEVSEEQVRALQREIISTTGKLEAYEKAIEDTADKMEKLGSAGNEVESASGKLKQTIKEQEDALSQLKTEYADIVLTQGKNSAAAKELAQGIDKLSDSLSQNKTTLNEAEKEADGFDKSLEDTGNAAEDAGDKALKLGDIIKANLISDVIKSGLSALADGVKGVGEKFKSFLDLGESTKEMQTAMAKLETSFNSAGLGSETANKSVTALYGVLGDTDRSVEASNLLAKMSKNEADLDANTRILTGVFAEYGDSIPTEGLAEGMQATAEMGSVQGVLADALEWQGINLDDYNAKLETMSSSEERAAYIQQTLTDLYGESADAYRKENEALIASNEAQLQHEQLLAQLGQTTLTTNTAITSISNSLMSGFIPAIQGAMEGVGEVTNGFADLVNAVVNGGDVDGAMQAFAQSVDTVIDSIANSLPKVIELGGKLIETLVSAIEENAPTIISEGGNLITSLINGITENIASIASVAMDIIVQLATALIQNLPAILEAAIQIIVGLCDSLSEQLPTLIPVMVEAVVTICETLIDNIDLIIDAAIDLIIALANGLLQALPKLIAKAPVLIEKLVSAITENLPKIIEMGIKLTVQLAAGLIKAIPQLVSKLPQLIKAIVNGLKSGVDSIASVGKNLVSGLWNGIRNATTWIKTKIKNWVGDVMSFLKKLFGIHSPSKETAWIGEMLDKGLAEGIEDYSSEPIKAFDQLGTDLLNADNLNGATIDRQLNTTFSGAISNDSNKLDTLVSLVAVYMPELIKAAQKSIILDDGTLVGKLAPQIDVELGYINGLKARGI